MQIPLFPLHTVLCPGIVLPLHIFEDRYRALTRHCLDNGAPFGVVLIRDGGEVGPGRTLALAGVGALVEIREAGRYPDGRYDLLAAATGRFAIDEVDPAREPYLVAEVTPLEDEVGDEARAERLAASAIGRFVRYLELMRARDGETTEALDIRVEVDAGGSADDAAPDDDDADDDDDALFDDADGDDVVLPPGALEIESVGPGAGGGAPDRSRHPGRPDDPLVPAVRDRPDRAAAPPGAPRGGHDGRAARGADQAPRPRGPAARKPAPVVRPRPEAAARVTAELSPDRAAGVRLSAPRTSAWRARRSSPRS